MAPPVQSCRSRFLGDGGILRVLDLLFAAGEGDDHRGRDDGGSDDKDRSFHYVFPSFCSYMIFVTMAVILLKNGFVNHSNKNVITARYVSAR